MSGCCEKGGLGCDCKTESDQPEVNKQNKVSIAKLVQGMNRKQRKKFNTKTGRHIPWSHQVDTWLRDRNLGRIIAKEAVKLRGEKNGTKENNE